VLNIGNNVLIDNNFTITIEPGAIMSVDGTLFCNGLIRCYGTIILQEDACMGPFTSGKIVPTDGYFYLMSNDVNGCNELGGEGNLVIMKGAKFAVDPYHTKLYCSGACIFNCGTAVLGTETFLTNSTITNEGFMVGGYIPSNYLSLESTEASFEDNKLIFKNGIKYGNPYNTTAIPFVVQNLANESNTVSSLYNYGYCNFTGNVEGTELLKVNTGTIINSVN